MSFSKLRLLLKNSGNADGILNMLGLRMLIACPVGRKLGEHSLACVMHYCNGRWWREILSCGVKVVESQLKLGTGLA